MHYAMNITQI